jgi:hypothetical protein
MLLDGPVSEVEAAPAPKRSLTWRSKQLRNPKAANQSSVDHIRTQEPTSKTTKVAARLNYRDLDPAWWRFALCRCHRQNAPQQPFELRSLF